MPYRRPPDRQADRMMTTFADRQASRKLVNMHARRYTELQVRRKVGKLDDTLVGR